MRRTPNELRTLLYESLLSTSCGLAAFAPAAAPRRCCADARGDGGERNAAAKSSGPGVAVKALPAEPAAKARRVYSWSDPLRLDVQMRYAPRLPRTTPRRKDPRQR